LWKEQPSGYFSNLKIHNGNIKGIKGNSCPTKFRLKHYGYLYNEWLSEKTDLYLSVDDNLENHKMYINHKYQNVKTWEWNENICFNLVLQNAALNFILYFILIPKSLLNKIFKPIYKF
jgi:hypothetical protein